MHERKTRHHPWDNQGHLIMPRHHVPERSVIDLKFFVIAYAHENAMDRLEK
jgi:hypothetical protein